MQYVAVLFSNLQLDDLGFKECLLFIKTRVIDKDGSIYYFKIPYIGGLSEKLQSVLDGEGTKVLFYHRKTVGKSIQLNERKIVMLYIRWRV